MRTRRASTGLLLRFAGSLAAVCLAGMLGGIACASCKSTPEKRPRPYWVDNPAAAADGLAAVGIAQKAKRTDYRAKAEAHARRELAAAIYTHMKGVVEVYNRATERGQVSVADSRIEAFVQANLSGSEVKATFEDENLYYVFVVLRNPAQVMDQAKQAIVEAGGDPGGAESVIAERLRSLEEKRREFEASPP